MIRLTKLSDYGFVLLTYLAYRNEQGAHAARDVAEATGLPLPMAGKILKMLTRGGLLVSHRGIKGGYSLARKADQITATDIIQALEGPISLTECISHSPSSCHVESLCPVRVAWQRINEAVTGALNEITLAELVWPSRTAQPQPEPAAQTQKV